MKANSRNALVIGASRGLGLALVRELLSRGWTVTATLRHDEKSELPSLAGAWPEQLMIEQLDVVEDSEIDALSARLGGARAAFGAEGPGYLCAATLTKHFILRLARNCALKLF